MTMTTTDLERVIAGAAEQPGAMEEHEVSAVKHTVELLD